MEDLIDLDSRKRAAFERFVKSEEFPCVGAKAALAKGTVEIFDADYIDRTAADLPLYRALAGFADRLDPDAEFVQSFVAIFSGPVNLSERDFERALWDRLQGLHNIDIAAGHEWTEESDPDPSSPHFSMSIDGTAFFVVGLCPEASRSARRFEYPALVFNAHEQFERMRERGLYDRMKTVIRTRDAALDGTANPMLADHGSSSEARQYSGRPVGRNWQCPLEIQEPLDVD